uniref:CCHC-type domain-containing protein n=1 Tax=Cacopsylla melanoneura TaxID=428564 RepID=A0A8D9B6L7_9HEMI
MYTTEMLLRPESESIPSQVISCVFCEGKHYSDSCQKYASLDERKQSVNGRCYICLSQSHLFRNCPKQNKYCYYCKAVGKHHRSLCPRQFGSFATNPSDQHKYHGVSNERSRAVGSGDRVPIPGTSGKVSLV